VQRCRSHEQLGNLSLLAQGGRGVRLGLIFKLPNQVSCPWHDIFCAERVASTVIKVYSRDRVLSFFSTCRNRNWVSPTPSPAGERAPPPGSGDRGTLACGRGGGGVSIPTRGQTLWCSMYICTWCSTCDWSKENDFVMYWYTVV
jgi:hypothetical protein